MNPLILVFLPFLALVNGQTETVVDPTYDFVFPSMLEADVAHIALNLWTLVSA